MNQGRAQGQQNHSHDQHRLLALAPLALAALLAACGGGGGDTNEAPTVVARLSGEAVLNATTTFDTAGTLDPDGTVTSATWNYGDGLTGSTNSHVYAATGSYTAVLTVTDDQGASTSKSVPVTVAKCSAAGTTAANLSPQPTVCMQTTMGEIVVEVYPTQAPVTTANFLKYVTDGFYAGTLFHRVIKDFVVQGGGFTTGMVAKTPTYADIVLESNNGLKNWQYTLAMARRGTPNSASSQFFINLLDNNACLDIGSNAACPGKDVNGYAVFGQVISGTAVVDAIGAVANGTFAGFSNVPTTDVVIRSAVRLP